MAEAEGHSGKRAAASRTGAASAASRVARGWTRVWSSLPRAIATGIVLSVVLASVLYAFDWLSFYDSRDLAAQMRAEQVANDISLLAQVVPGPTSPDDARLRSAVERYVGQRQEARIVVTATRGHDTLWTASNAAPLSQDRTRVEAAFVREPKGREGLELTIGVHQAVRPPFLHALYRAWTWSWGDFLEQPADWWFRRLYNRSIPLYGYWLVLLLVGFPSVRALHRGQLEIARLDAETRHVAEDLRAMRDLHVEQLRGIEGRLARTESQRDAARQEREQLASEIARVETRYDGSSGYRAPEGGATDEPLGQTATLARLESIEARKGDVETALQGHDEQIGGLSDQLRETRAELDAAEQLLEELEAQGGGLALKLRDRNREIRRLKNLLQRARNATMSLSRSSVALQLEGVGVEDRPIEAQLLRWLRSDGEAQVSFSAHSRASKVKAQFERIDRGFVDRFFTHVVNPEYARGARRTIRIVPEPATDGPGGGELIVALDDDAGRTLGLRYELRRGAPESEQVGFILAMLLRSGCRDFRNFDIRTR